MPSLPQVIRRRAMLLPLSFAVVAMLCSTAAQEIPLAKPATVEAHLGRGYDALKKDQYETAASEFRAALAIDPNLTERARFPLAVALFEMHQSAEARREFESLRSKLGNHPNIVYYLGRLDIEASDFKSAVQNLTKAQAKPPFPDTA